MRAILRRSVLFVGMLQLICFMVIGGLKVWAQQETLSMPGTVQAPGVVQATISITPPPQQQTGAPPIIEIADSVDGCHDTFSACDAVDSTVPGMCTKTVAQSQPAAYPANAASADVPIAFAPVSTTTTLSFQADPGCTSASNVVTVTVVPPQITIQAPSSLVAGQTSTQTARIAITPVNDSTTSQQVYLFIWNGVIGTGGLSQVGSAVTDANGVASIPIGTVVPPSATTMSSQVQWMAAWDPWNYLSYGCSQFVGVTSEKIAICGFAPLTLYMDNSTDLGDSCKSGREAVCGSPINLTNGNTYVQQQDYFLPGLGGGIQLSRSWNSEWVNNTPWENSGMFGDSWQSNYEAHIQVTQTGAKYWRGDGSAWSFTYSNGVYSLTSPPDERASLSFSTSTNQFTLTLSNGSKQIFNQPGFLLSVVDRNGNTTSLGYDGQNRLTTVTDAASRVLSFNHANSSFPSLVTSIQDSVGTFATYSYDTGGHLSRVTYGDGSVINYNYDANGLITSTTDAQAKTLETHTYDSLRRGLSSQAANGVDSLGISYSGNFATLTDSGGNTTTYTSGTRIASRNFLTSIAGSGCDTCVGRRNYTFTYDTSGNRTSSTDPMGHITNYSYDSNGNVTQKSIQMDSVPNYQIWQYTYNGFNEVLTATDPLGKVTTNTYDTKGNLLTTTTPSPGGTTAGSKTTFTYDTKGELTQITDPLGHATTMAYYPTGLLQTVTDAQKKVTQFQYDARGNRTALIDANNQQTTFSYDAMNRVTKITYPTSPATFTQIGYDYRGRKSSITDQNGKVTRNAYDDADRLISITDPNNGVTQYAYDNENNLTILTDAAGHQTTFQYDQYGSVTQTAFPSGWTETYSYDPNGNLLSRTDRNGHTVNFGYDFLNRLGTKTYPDSSTVTYTYDNSNRVTRVVDGSGTYTYTYDGMGRLTQTSTSYAFISGKTFTLGYAYDANSNRTSMTDPQNASTAYVYDTLNRLTTLTYPSKNSYSFTYDALGRRTQLTRPNGVTSTYQFDSLSRLLSVLHKKSTTTLDGTTYAYDASGNRTSKTDNRTNVASSFSYDPLYELTQVLQGSTTVENYSYDAVGNRLTALGVSPYAYNTSNELTSTPSTTYTYDKNGNMLTKADSTGTTTYTWDFENRLSSLTLPGSGGTVSFKYDPFGRRVQKTSSSGTTNYIYDAANVLEEVDTGGIVLARYIQTIAEDDLLAQTRSATTSYYEQDALGSISSLSNSSGALANTYTYDSYGRLVGSTGTIVNAHRYTGRDFDGESGLYYYRARYYDPALGRFISEDPAREAGGLNLYRYADNSPTNLVDSSGLWPGQGWWNGVQRNASFAWNWFWETDNFGDAAHVQFNGHDFLFYGPNTAETQDMMNSFGGAYMRWLYKTKFNCQGSPQNQNFGTLPGYLTTTWNPGNTAFQVGAFSFDINDLGNGNVQYTMYNKAGWHSLLGGLNGNLGDHDRDPAFPMHEMHEFGGNVRQMFQWQGKKSCGCE